MAQFEAFIGVNFWTALLTLGNFLLVLYFGRKYLYSPVLKLIQARQKEIDDLYASADTAQQQAEALRDDYRKKLAAAQAESERIVKEAVSRGQSREEEIIRAATAEANAVTVKAAADIARQKQKAVSEAKGEIADLAMEIAGKVVERELSGVEQHRLIDRFIDELGENL